MTNRGLRILIGSTAMVVAAGCSTDSVLTPNAGVPQPSAAVANNVRTLGVELTKPAVADGGMIFSIEGPNILSIAPASGLDLVSYGADSKGRTTIDVLVTGPLTNGVIAWLTVKGVNSGNPFELRVSQVAAGAADGFVQRADLSGYSVTVRR